MKTFLYILGLMIMTNILIASSTPPPPETMIRTENSCHSPIYIAIVSAMHSPELPAASTGFVLFPGDSAAVFVPSRWSGFVWARTHCAIGPAAFLCLTGDCGSGTVACSRAGTLVPPRAATVAHFIAAEEDEEEYEFFVSDAAAGFNVAVLVTPLGGTGVRCSSTEFSGWDLKGCREDLRVLDGDGRVVGCESSDDDGGGNEGFVSPDFVCFAANYNIRFCASSGFPKHSSHSVDHTPSATGYKPYNPNELGSENKQYSKGKTGLTLTVIGILSGLGVFGFLLWWIINKFCCGNDGCFNGSITVNCFNFFKGSISTS